MVTIADVARRAGVSTSTVSFVLNGRTSVSDATRRRVQRSVAELGYHPNAGAKALAGRRHAYDVLLITSDEGPQGVRRVAASGLADGVILMVVELDDPRIQVLREQGTQAALIGLPDDSRQLSCVDHDFAVAGGCARTTSAASATGTSPSSATAPGSTNGTPGTPNAPSQGSPSGPDSAACASCTARATETKDWEDVPVRGGYPGAERGYGIADLAATHASDTPHRADGCLAYHVLEVMEALLAAAEAGQPVHITSTPVRPAAVPAHAGRAFAAHTGR